jgi:HEAT repeat protein
MPALSYLSFALWVLAAEESVQLARDAQRQAAEDVRLLNAARVPTDGPELVRFLSRQTLTAAEETRLEGVIRALADKSFKVRERATAELLGRGPPVLPLLRRGLQGADLETARRIQRCLEGIRQEPWLRQGGAAARRLQTLRPEGACAALIVCLPLADDEVQEEMLAAVLTLGAPHGNPDPALAKALRDREPSRRAAAALVLGWRGDAAQREAVRGLLRKDPDPEVRLRAAEGLLAGGDSSAIAVLIGTLAEADPDRARRAEDLLRWAAGPRAPTVKLGATAVEGMKAHAAWQAWWHGERGRFQLAVRQPDLSQAGARRRGRDLAGRFLEALKKNDRPTLRATTDVPFFARTTGTVYKTREQLDAILKLGEAFEVVGAKDVRGLAQYLQGAGKAAAPFFADLPPSGVYAVQVELRVRGRVLRVALLVRTRGGPPRLIGIDRSEAP